MCASVGFFFVCVAEKDEPQPSPRRISSPVGTSEESALSSGIVGSGSSVRAPFIKIKLKKTHLFYGCIRNRRSGKWNLQREPLMKSLFSHEALCHYGLSVK